MTLDFGSGSNMTSDKSYTQCKETLGCIKYSRIELKNCLSGLTEIYKDFFFSKDAQKDPKKWIFRGERRKKDGKDKLDCKKCTGKSTCCSKDDNVVFRTSLEKAFRAYEIDSADDRKKWEKNLNRAFKRKLHHYTNNVPADGDILEWLALTRHYFGPTRLLDCTYSFFVACYFALNEMDYKTEQAEVWAIDANWLSYKKDEEEKIERISEIIGSKKYNDFEKKTKKLVNERYADKNCSLDNEIIHFLMKQGKPLVYNVTPFRLNERVIAQNGTFLLQGDIKKCFVRNLEGTFSRNELKDKNNLRRVVIKFDTIVEKKNILRLLNDMGIKHAALFPDLRGFAESLWRRLAFPW